MNPPNTQYFEAVQAPCTKCINGVMNNLPCPYCEGTGSDIEYRPIKLVSEISMDDIDSMMDARGIKNLFERMQCRSIGKDVRDKLAPTIAVLRKEKQELNQELFLKNRKCELLAEQLLAEKEEARKKLIGFLFELRLDGDDKSKSIAEVVDNYLKDSSLTDKQSEGK